MSDTRHVKGLDALQKFLDQLTPKVEKNIMRGALREGIKVVRPAAQANIHSVSGLLSASLDHPKAISTNTQRGVVTAKLRAGTGFGQSGTPPANLPIWVEYGTRRHFISIAEDAKPSRMTRRGLRTFSIGTINRMVARGSLFINGAFVGKSVSHPGAEKRPFMRPALDNMAAAAVIATGEYIKNRLATKHGMDTADIEIEEGET